ncbi:multiple inositol polyphosphate phosphatase 1-like [Asparagus officinalis]|uniref:multiple inositol polyphosphate phosphatase 1-like n=1 Tax=Asparagus officinalis TaxID=4686 RepID=UPI00098E0BAF|nr:multiple inositol polyphosphate phosphatase 1-like [Asparagus officinalis]
MRISLLLASLFTSLILSRSAADEKFDVRQHLATVTRYGVAKDSNTDSFVPSVIPDGCSAIHLNLLARHGTRSPTTKRIKELDRLAARLDVLLNDAKDEAGQNSSSLNTPAWLWGWRSPWEGKQKGGELINKGEEELYLLGKRIKEKFAELFDEEYHPDVFSIRATQVPRASASAVAFGIGLFAGKGNLGPGGHRAFSVISESRASDMCLRFYDSCQTYRRYKENQEPAVDKIKEPILRIIAAEVGRRYQLGFTKQDVASLWFLCKQEASLLDITNQACGLFNATEVSLLEWTDDLEGFLLNGYGNSEVSSGRLILPYW